MREDPCRSPPVWASSWRAFGVGLLCLLPLPSFAGSVYLCKAYSGGSFWSAEPCQLRQALVDRIVSVPDGLSFKEQVRLGEHERVEADRLRQPAGGEAGPAVPPRHRPARGAASTSGRSGECAALDAKMNKLDAQARQPQTAKAQDKIAAQKLKWREKQTLLRC
ncbi:MAG: hypothetical protein RL375_3449 [Pseudomonadota bacterium]